MINNTTAKYCSMERGFLIFHIELKLAWTRSLSRGIFSNKNIAAQEPSSNNQGRKGWVEISSRFTLFPYVRDSEKSPFPNSHLRAPPPPPTPYNVKPLWTSTLSGFFGGGGGGEDGVSKKRIKRIPWLLWSDKLK